MRKEAMGSLLIVVALLAVACSRSEVGSTSTLPSPTSPERPIPPTTAVGETLPPDQPETTVAPSTATTEPLVLPDSVPSLPGRLVVSAPSGELLVADNGQIRVAVPVPQGGRVFQPTWGPADGLLAYSHVDDGGSYVVVLNPAGSEVQRIATPFVPFYIYWSPDGQRIAALGANPAGGVQFGVGQVSDGTFTTLSGGTAYFFDWAPAEGRVVSHAAPQRLLTVDVAGASNDLAPVPGAFQAPEYTPDGSSVIVAIRKDGSGLSVSADGLAAQAAGIEQQIVHLDLTTGTVTPLVEFTTQAAFDLSPDGGRLAYTLANTPGSNFVGPLAVLNLATGVTETVTEEPVLGFEWSPSGDSLLFLSADGDNRLHWSVRGDGQTTAYPPQPPTGLFFLEYLPFWSQYARSLTLWAPDGSAFVYPLLTSGGHQEIWVQPLESAEPLFVSPGSFAGWSR